VYKASNNQEAYHFLAHIKQGFAQVQDLQQALGVGITQPQHCPPQQQVQAGHSCVSYVGQLHQQQVCCFYVASKVSTEQQLPAGTSKTNQLLPNFRLGSEVLDVFSSELLGGFGY